MASIEKAYCWEMQKIANPYQVRVAFFSSENTHERFHFFCIGCGIPLEGYNVMSHRDLIHGMHRKPMFKVWKDSDHRTGCSVGTLKSSSSPGKSSKKSSVTHDDFYYTHLFLKPLDTGLALHLPSVIPAVLPKTILDTAVTHNVEYLVEETSNLKDIVDCYIELRDDLKLKDILLHIEDAPIGTTYNEVFKPIRFIPDFFKYGHSKVKYRIHYGNVMNKAVDKIKNPGCWSFYVTADGKSTFFKDENEKPHPVSLEVILPISLLDTNLHMKTYIQGQLDAGKRLHECYIVNTGPQLPRLVENSEDPTKFHYESQIIIQDLNHIVLTFKL